MENLSMASASENVIGEASESTGTISSSQARKRAREVTLEPRSKFRGVAHVPSGKWTAQIYYKQDRFYLGTFETDIEAAMVYDSACIKLRKGHAYRNLPWTKINVEETKFQSLYSTEAILKMLKEGTYQSQFKMYLRRRDLSTGTSNDIMNSSTLQHKEGELVSCRLLFEKQLSPSDVGFIHRFVIPKKSALKFFPQFRESEGEIVDEEDPLHQTVLVFYDRMMRCWKFGCYYLRNSKSYVLGRDWHHFVKDKDLKAKDTIAFYSCESKDGAGTLKSFCMIGVRKNGVSVENEKDAVLQVEMNLELGGQKGEGRLQEKPLMERQPNSDEVKQGCRIFGVELR